MKDKKDEKNQGVSKIVEGLTAVDPNVLKDFLREMNEEAIPEIVKTVDERRLRAAESLQWQLKC
jgi:hypothetical protein